jgi:hypothetical protein
MGEKNKPYGQKHFLALLFFVKMRFHRNKTRWASTGGASVRGGYVLLRVRIIFNLLNSCSIDNLYAMAIYKTGRKMRGESSASVSTCVEDAIMLYSNLDIMD